MSIFVNANVNTIIHGAFLQCLIKTVLVNAEIKINIVSPCELH